MTKKNSSGKKVEVQKQVQVVEQPREELDLVEEVTTPEKKVVYDKLEVIEYSTTSEHGALDPDAMKLILEWETEQEYQKRRCEEEPGSKPEAFLFYDDFHCLNSFGKKVRCHNNAGNRPFDIDWCKDLARMVLRGEWAGPLTVPGETINGETIRISKYGRVLSGQHQGTALILADEELKFSRSRSNYDPDDPETEKYLFWRGHEHPVIETLVVMGLSEDERILRTIDYVKPRTFADMLFTMPLFRSNTPVQRKEMTRMLASAVDLLWTRTCAQGYKTHPELALFLERHERLLQCVEHLFVENRVIPTGGKVKREDGESDEQYEGRNKARQDQGGRRISKLRLSAGQCAAMMYLMGCSDTPLEESDDYRNASPPTEELLDWSLYPRAREFWTKLTGDRTFVPVRKALHQVAKSEPDSDENQGLGGRFEEKLAIISQAWSVFKDHPETSGDPFPFEVVDGIVVSDDLEPPDGVLSLCYSNLDDKSNILPDGRVKLVNVADLLGIDCPNEGKKAKVNKVPIPKDPTPEEIAERAAVERQRKEDKEEDKKKKNKERSKKKVTRK